MNTFVALVSPQACLCLCVCVSVNCFCFLFAPNRSEGKAPAGINAAKKAVRLVAAMALQDVSDGCHLGQVGDRCGSPHSSLMTTQEHLKPYRATPEVKNTTENHIYPVHHHARSKMACEDCVDTLTRDEC